MFGLFNEAPDANAAAGVTPESIKARRALARALAERGSDASPVEHWLQGAARLGDALNGAIENYQTDKAEREGRAAITKEIDGISSIAPASTPAAGAAPAIGANANDVSERFIRTVQEGGITNPNALAAIGATGQRESAWSAKNAGATWSDPSESGQAGTSGGTLSWRGPRLAALQAFARESGEQGLGAPETQARFFLRENPQLVQQLNNAKTPEEAMTAMNNAWRFAGFNRPGGERDARIAAARAWAPRFATAPAQTIEQRGPVDATAQPAVGRGDGRYQVAQLPDGGDAAMVDAPMPPRRPSDLGGQANMPAQGASPAQGFVVPGQPAQAQANGQGQVARLMSVMGSPNYSFASEGQRRVLNAMLQQAIAREGRDPNEARLRQLQVRQAEAALADRPLTRRQQELAIQKAERDAGRVELETMTAPDGTVFEREKGKPGSQWTQSLRLPPKPEDRTTDQRELDQANRERQAADLPALRMDEYKTQKARAGATTVNNDLTGGSSKQVFDTIKERWESAQSAASGLTALAEARRAVEDGGIFGAGADARLGFAKLGQLLGFEDGRIVNTETFRAAIAPQVAAMVKATVGATQISNADREFAERAAGGSIALDERSVRRLLDIGERASRVVIDRHQRQIDAVYPETPDGKFARERALFSVSVSEPARPQAQSGPALPRPGEVVRGYRFRGGNPADQSAWEKVN